MKPLTPEQRAVVEEAVKIHNDFYRARKADHVDATVDDYLDDIVKRHIEGLGPAVEAEKALTEAQERREAAARRRLNLTDVGN